MNAFQSLVIMHKIKVWVFGIISHLSLFQRNHGRKLIKQSEKTLKERGHKLTWAQLRRVKKVPLDLEFGADSHQETKLPPITDNNSSSAHLHGELLTDKIASWVNSNFVAGLFQVQPMPGFRANKLMATAK